MGYNLVVNTSNFKPYDYSNAFKIAEMIKEANYRAEEQANKIQEEHGKYILPEGSTYAETQKAFWDDFKSASDAFYNDRNRDTINAIKNMRRRFTQEITPIKTMVDNYNKTQDKIMSLGPNAIIGNRAQLSKVDNFYGGVIPTVNYRDMNTIYNTAAKTTQGIDNAFASAPTKASEIANQYFVLKQQGLNSADATKALMKDRSVEQSGLGEDVTSLLNALEKVYNQFSFEGDTPENTEVWNTVVSGAIAGMSAPKYSLQHNQNYESDAEREARQEQSIRNSYTIAGAKADLENSGYEVNLDDQGKVQSITYNPEQAVERHKGSHPRNTSGKPTFEVDGKLYYVNPVTISTIAGNQTNYQVISVEDGNVVTDTNIRNKVLTSFNNSLASSKDLEKIQSTDGGTSTGEGTSTGLKSSGKKP